MACSVRMRERESDISVCVCVCERERERERKALLKGNGLRKNTYLQSWQTHVGERERGKERERDRGKERERGTCLCKFCLPSYAKRSLPKTLRPNSQESAAEAALSRTLSHSLFISLVVLFLVDLFSRFLCLRFLPDSLRRPSA